MGDLLNSFEYGIPAAIIVAIYLVINKVLDTRKDKKQATISENLITGFTKLNNFLEYFTKDIIEKEQEKCNFAIESCFNSFSDALCKFSINTIIHNNVSNNKETIIANVRRLVDTEYWNIYSCLLLFKSGNSRVSDYLDTTWKEDITKDIIGIILNESKTKEQRIYDVNNKIHIDTNAYKIHIINKYAKRN